MYAQTTLTMKNYCCIALLFHTLIIATYAHTDRPLMLLISFDGFRWDYLNMASVKGKDTPNFNKLKENGVFVQDGVINVFVTKTFPNHYSIVTGLYEESHGVIGNEMFDISENKSFHIDNSRDTSNPFWFDNGSDNYTGYPEPIWLTNQNGGQGRRSGTMFWPGSEAVGMTPFRYIPYNNSYPDLQRIDTVVGWFITEDNPINLGFLYFSEPDALGHSVGPDSPKILDMIVSLDKTLGYLLNKLQENNLFSRLNIILTSDHGMATVNDSIPMDELIDKTLYTRIDSGPVWNILPKEGKEDELYNLLTKVPNLITYRKADIPEKYHYKENRRIMPIVIEAKPGYLLCENSSIECNSKGAHGYNNELSSMHPIFIASGPAFKKNYTSTQFNMVDIYPLMCHILDITPAPHNGSLANIEHILFTEGFTFTSITLMASIMFCALISGICCIASSRLFLRRRVLRPSHQALKAFPISSQTQSLLTSEDEDAFP